MATWYLDSNIIVSVATGRSEAAREWYERCLENGDDFVASRFMEVEARHVVTNMGGDHQALDAYLCDVNFYEVDEQLMIDAIDVPGVISGADAVHLATAFRIGESDPIITTHDAQFAHAAKTLAFRVHDPITDDPARPPVATLI